MNLTTSSNTQTKVVDRVLRAGLLGLSVAVGVIAGVVIAYDYTNLGLLGISVLGFAGFVIWIEEAARRAHRRIALRPSNVLHVRSASSQMSPVVEKHKAGQGRHRR